jgi:hypothetical protein
MYYLENVLRIWRSQPGYPRAQKKKKKKKKGSFLPRPKQAKSGAVTVQRG